MKEKSLNIVYKHVFICSNLYIYTTVVQEVYNRDRSPEVDDVKDLAAAATKHLDLLKHIYIQLYIYIENIDEGVPKLLISATFIRQLVSVRFTFHYQVYLSAGLRQT